MSEVIDLNYEGVEQKPLKTFTEKAYLDYSMYVIMDRALPHIGDGLKPVQRRILYAMDDMGLSSTRSFKKSASIVGEVMGKYHPHGDSAIYDAMVRLAQDFSMRYPLVDGQGNFGSVDNDPPAAMRYTEARLTALASEMLTDIDKETVDFVPNYDESLTEPSVLPTKIPALMVNGAAGIAVGMATNIPPHNLTEISEGIKALIDNPEMTCKDLMKIIPGPDFPTSGIIYGNKGITEAYTTGRGIIRIRGKVVVEKNRRDNKETILITEIPYQVNKARLIEKIADLIKNKQMEGVKYVRDESDREGMRIALGLKRDQLSGVIVNQLYKHSLISIDILMMT